MGKYIVKRVLLMIPTMLIVTAMVFLLINITPVDPARIILGIDVAPEEVEALNRESGGRICVNQDITAEIRLGQIYYREFGNLFVENFNHRCFPLILLIF